MLTYVRTYFITVPLDEPLGAINHGTESIEQKISDLPSKTSKTKVRVFPLTRVHNGCLATSL